MGIPTGYRTYQRIAWIDMMNDRYSSRFYKGPPTVSNVEAHIITASERNFDSFYAEEVDFYGRCRTFRDCMFSNSYIRKRDEVFEMDSENSRAVGENFYCRDRTEPVIEVTEKGYRRFAYLYLLNDNTKKVINKYDIDRSGYSYSNIAIPVWTDDVATDLTYGTMTVYRLHKNTRENLSYNARETLCVDDNRVESRANEFSDDYIPWYL